MNNHFKSHRVTPKLAIQRTKKWEELVKRMRCGWYSLFCQVSKKLQIAKKKRC